MKLKLFGNPREKANKIRNDSAELAEKSFTSFTAEYVWNKQITKIHSNLIKAVELTSKLFNEGSNKTEFNEKNDSVTID